MCKDCIKSAFDKTEHNCECCENSVQSQNTENTCEQKSACCENSPDDDEEDSSKLSTHVSSGSHHSNEWKNAKGETCYVDDHGKTCCSTDEELIKHWWPVFKDEKWDIIFSLTVGLPLVINFIGMLFGAHLMFENKYLFLSLASVLVFFTLPKKLYTAYNEVKKNQFSHIILQVFAIGTVYVYSSIVVLFNINMKFDFDCLPFILIIFAIAEIIEDKVVDRINNNIAKETKITQRSKVIKIENGTEIEMWPEDLNIGDVYYVKNGQQVPVDSIVISENSIFDTSAITGEIKPYSPQNGADVLSGSINKSKIIQLKVKNDVHNSLLATLDKELANLQAKDTQTYAIGQKFLRAILFTIVAVSLVNFVSQFFMFGIERAILTSIAVILITCPCGIAAGLPLLFSIYMSELLKNKVLVRDLVFIEKIRKIKGFAFDKTGTITSSIASVYEIDGDESVLKQLYSIEKFSTHPIAQSIVSYLDDKNFEAVKFDLIDEISGKGIHAQKGDDIYYVGSKKLMEMQNIDIKSIAEDDKLSENGFIIIYVSVNNEIRSRVILNSKLIDGSKDMISYLNTIGKTYLITGDNEKVGNYISKEVNMTSTYCNVSPMNKLDIIKDIQKETPVLYVGDGINDSLSLKQADLSISFSNGSDIAKESAKSILLNHDLTLISKLIKFSIETSKNMRQAMWITYIYNIITMTLAITSLVSLEFAPFAEVVSVAIIVLNVYRLKLKSEKIFKK